MFHFLSAIPQSSIGISWNEEGIYWNSSCPPSLFLSSGTVQVRLGGDTPERTTLTPFEWPLLVRDQSSFSVVEFQSASKQRSSGRPFPGLCTPVVFQNNEIPWFDKDTTQYLLVQNTFLLTLRQNIILGFQKTKSWPRSAWSSSGWLFSDKDATVLKFTITSSKTLLQNSVYLNLQLMDLEIAGRNPLFYWH